MRRLAILLVPTVATLGVTVGSVMAAAPAQADPLASVSVIVNRPPVDSLLQLCLSSQSLHPDPACVDIG
jgi:hypothetical protein